VFIWTIYFGNLPRYRFGTIKQQFFLALHLPLHLAILGVVEGSQHIALARYYTYCTQQLFHFVYHGCVLAHLDGETLRQNLSDAISYFKIYESPQGALALPYVYEQIYYLGNQTGTCSVANTSDPNNGLGGMPLSSEMFMARGFGAIFQSFNYDIPREGEVYGTAVADRSWRVVYTYYWSAMLFLLFCLTMSALLADRGLRSAKQRLWAFLARAKMMAVAIIVLALGLSYDAFFYPYVGSAWVLPTVVVQLWVVCLGDWVSKWRVAKKETNEGSYQVVDLAEASVEDRGLRVLSTGALRGVDS
jgi:hypothetical protein